MDTQIYDYKTILTKCRNIGLWTINRSRSSCKFATPFCKMHCYNKKLEAIFNHTIAKKDIINDKIWSWLDGDKLKQALSHIKTVKRIRLMTRGEAFTSLSDTMKVLDMVTKNPDWIFWIPTRAWQDSQLRHFILNRIKPLPNVRIQASIDPYTTNSDVNLLQVEGWNLAYFGTNDLQEGFTRCPKTWKKARSKSTIKCSECNICFGTSPVNVHYKMH